jgi:spore coat protein CotF
METFQQVDAPVPSEVKNFPYDERLSSWELSQLWLIYQANSSIKCMLQYFVATAQDPEIKAVLNDAVNGLSAQLSTATSLFNSVGFPIPHAFSDEEVEPNAKRLYSDSLMLAYLRTIIKFGLVKLAHALPLASRPDVRDYLNSALVFTQNLFNKTQDLLGQKGVATKPPYTPVPDRVKYITNKKIIAAVYSVRSVQ